MDTADPLGKALTTPYLNSLALSRDENFSIGNRKRKDP